MKFQRIDLTGQRFERLVVTALADVTKHRRPAWVCRCDCGNTVTVGGQFLRSGKSKSCGCLKAEKMRSGLGRTHGMAHSRTYKSWESMIGRCYRINDPSYARYGARGVTVCARWLSSFPNFLADMGERPEGATLDRYPNSLGNYEPSNCRWATHKQQSNNTRANRTVSYKGREMTAREISDMEDVPYEALRSRVFRYGWDAERAVDFLKRPT